MLVHMYIPKSLDVLILLYCSWVVGGTMECWIRLYCCCDPVWCVGYVGGEVESARGGSEECAAGG